MRFLAVTGCATAILTHTFNKEILNLVLASEYSAVLWCIIYISIVNEFKV